MPFPKKYFRVVIVIASVTIFGTWTYFLTENTSVLNPISWLIGRSVDDLNIYTLLKNTTFKHNHHHKRKYMYSSRHLQRIHFLTFENTPSFPYFYKPKGSGDKRSKKKLILFYNPPEWFGDTSKCEKGVEMCPVKSCRCSHDSNDISQADGVLFHTVGLNDAIPPKKSPDQVWIFFGLESPFHYYGTALKSSNWRHVFNWTMTYRTDSDIVMPYDILVRQSNQSTKNYNEIAERKSKHALWMVSNCKTQSQREDYVRELQKHYNVDVYGECGQFNRRIQYDLPVLFKDYKFYLSFENSLCTDYITEKLFKIYNRNFDIVPIVRGGADYKSLIPRGTYINTADFTSPQKLAEYLKYLDGNLTAYTEILRKKDEYANQETERSFYSAFCDICVKLHDLKTFSKLYQDSGSWLIKYTCQNARDIVL